ncbi:MAG TPA: hypothetical protein VK731_12980, partial [Candidatus Cybelea sp.]|nr:hypothetical protein [Candidatus Cybelea sp.]
MTKYWPKLFRFSLLVSISLAAGSLRAELPEWIWHNNQGAGTNDGEVRFFRKTFDVKGKATKAKLSIAADDFAQIYLNGRKIGKADGWSSGTFIDVGEDLVEGENVLALRGTNITGPAAIVAMLEITFGRVGKSFILTDTSWLSSTNGPTGWNKPKFDDSGWTHAVSLGKLGIQPWGNVLDVLAATPVKEFKLLPGFKAELLHSSEPGEGSWICMTIDPKGRLIISPQEGVSNLLRVTLSSDGKVEKIEKINQPVGGAMGLLYAFDSLYVNGNGPSGLGLYRLKHHSGGDDFGAPELLRNIDKAAGEHGSHAVVLGPDKHLYIVSGNFTGVPKDILPTSPHRNYAEDQLLPRSEDGNGFGIGVQPPGGFILRMDRDGKNCELYAGGMRNTYDFAFNPDGEMIGFDSDMEYDWGMPWYRPIRICHLVSAGDYGFREGTGKWPKYYPDSLPSVVDVGIGSPTGMKFGTASNFPEKYKKALYALDWTYGRIFAVHLTPDGATYDGTFEMFLKGKPLNLTDIEFGKDGAMYFTTGGRGTESGLYRVSYVGPKQPEEESGPPKEQFVEAAKARALRHELEKFQGKEDPKALDFAWPYLDSNDRFIRYAARIVVESQPVNRWRERAISETRTNAGLTALLALARSDVRMHQGELLRALTKVPLDKLTESQQLDKLRVIELSFIRQGHPDEELTKMAIEKLDPHYPAKSERVNRELCQLLIYLQAPNVVTKTLALLDAAPTQEEQILYIFHLRKLKTGWTTEQREHYFSWFNRDQDSRSDLVARKHGDYFPISRRKGEAPQHPAELLKWFSDADREYGDGSSYPKFIANFRKDAMDLLTAEERTAIASYLTEKKTETITPTVEHKFVQAWTMEDLQPSLPEVTKNRSFAGGKEAFTSMQCFQCHRFDNAGGSIGPELTAISSRFSARDILESIILPS